ncbi:DinB family protein [Planococcus salinus]|uniref:DinB family protein n=1 Tax=Planococcus salinus TaxID=1848460 RepID=A0A3M8P5W7_9BACL|nr:DinB family protein [Planococcus salinus]RNF39002.1 DinB family protein [Planococcus salinus]
MQFTVEEAMEVLERTPRTLQYFLSGLSDSWLQSNEGEGTWNPSQVVGHLIEGEKNDWISRMEIILKEGENKVFPPFDRQAHLTEPEKPLDQKLEIFQELRAENIRKLKSYLNEESQLELTGQHPEFGQVTLRELLSTWVVHDLTHIAQIVRVMAERYRQDVGPWKAYLGILNRK